MEEQHHASLLSDPHAWVLVSAVIFAAVAWVKGRAPFLALLDSRTTRIRRDLDEAARLRREAEELLADYQNKHRDAVQTAQKIIDGANEAAARIRQETERKLEESITQREKVLLERIERSRNAALSAIRHQAADIAAKAAEELLADRAPKNSARLIDDMISELPESLKKKA